MRLATVINLLLVACAACALQLHHQARRDGFRSLSVIPRRSFQLISRRRLASRRIGSSIRPDIVPRGNTMYHCTFSDIFKELKDVKEKDVIQFGAHEPKIYRVKLPHGYFGENEVVVKEIHLRLPGWSEEQLKREARGLAGVNDLLGVLFDGETYFILMKDKGRKWVHGYPNGDAAVQLMKEADERVEEDYGMKRVYALLFPPNAECDYTWNRPDGRSWHLHPVGEWRFGERTGPGKPENRIPKDKHYCGIKEWDKDGLPVFLRLDSTTTTHHHTHHTG